MADVVGILPSLREQYAIERELGRGGMATVYLARDIKHDRRVALKVLSPDLSMALGAERFLREIQIVSHLTHPHILPIYDSGRADGTLYFVMPFIEGPTLRHRLRQERQLSIDESVRIAGEVASALAYAHAMGIVHRDVKPENILLEAGHAVVTDFGIARALSNAADEASLTQTGISLGTPAYMSPEQATGDRELDGRSDVYSLACVVYEMLAGQPPFTAPTTQALIARHLVDPVPPISTVRGSVPEEMEEVVLQALAKIPADRFATVTDFATALNDSAAWATTSGRRLSQSPTRTGSRAAAARRKRRIWRVATVSAALLLLTGVGVAGWRMRGGRVAEAAGGIDPRRIAVLYFQDETASGELGYLADALTESLIGELTQVRALTVVPRDGVLPFRGTTVQPDSVARALDVGTLVAGSLDREGNRVRVSVRLLDGATGADVERRDFEAAVSDPMASRDSLAQEASRLLRSWLGEEVHIRARRERARSVEHWVLFQSAERLRKDADAAFARGDRDGGALALARADSLLGALEALDPRWVDVPAMRATIAVPRVRRAPEAAEARRHLDDGVAHAERALAIDTSNVEALEARGTLRFLRYERQLDTDPAARRAVLRDAEQDLRAAVTWRPAQASAWNTLSTLAYRKQDIVGAKLAAIRAYEENAYLAAAEQVLWRLYATSYDLEQVDDARRWCEEGRRRFPQSPQFVECRLWLLTMRAAPPNVADGWRAVDDLARLTPEGKRELKMRRAQMLVAAALARAGQRDSARRVLARARADPDIDPARDLMVTEALVRLQLGDRSDAMQLLKQYLTEFPQHRAGMARNTWWWRDLRDDPEFRALVGIEQ